MKLTVLGSGKSNLGKDFRNTAAHLIEVNKTKVLLDCSDGTRGQLAKIGCKSLDIDAIFFSHFHPDHFSPQGFLQDYLVHGYNNPKKPAKITLFGPKTLTKKIEDTWMKLYNNEANFRDEFYRLIDMTIIELEDEQKVNFGDLEITAYKVIHGIMDAFAFRIESGGKCLTYSGDASICESIIKASDQSNLLLCEAALPLSGPVSDDMHVNAIGAAKIAEQSKAKQLVITHYSEEPTKMLESLKSTNYKGETRVAKDLSTYTL